MKKYKALIMVIVLLFTSSAFLQAESNQDEDLAKQIEDLNKKIERLEKHVQILEKQLKKYADSRIEIPQTFPKLDKIPKNWKEYEYQGVKYYLIPLSDR